MVEAVKQIILWVRFGLARCFKANAEFCNTFDIDIGTTDSCCFPCDLIPYKKELTLVISFEGVQMISGCFPALRAIPMAF